MQDQPRTEIIAVIGLIISGLLLVIPSALTLLRLS